MTSFCSSVVDDLFYEGLTGVLRVIPGGEEPEVRQTYEGLVHTVTGMYDCYRDLEILLEKMTGIDGDVGDDTKTVFRAFRLAWNFIDNAYAFQLISRTNKGKEIISIPSEIKEGFDAVCSFRNYADHLPSNFKNAATAKDFAPLFGWISYQVTPFFKDASTGLHSFFVTMISSSHLKGTYSISMPSHSSETVFGFIDCISIHIKKNLHFNISRFIQNIALFMNDWQISQISSLVEKAETDGGGLSSPFNRIVMKADLPSDHPINRYVIDNELLSNKVRVHVTFGK